MKILACDGIHADGLTLFEQAGFSVETSDPIKDAAVLAEKLKDFDAVVVRSTTLITAEALKQATHLKVIGRAGAGVDTIDVEAATARGIAVMNAPDGNTLAAAEHAVSLLFSMARHVPKADAGMKAGEWPKNGLTGFELEGKRLGVIGLGRIGATVARKAGAAGQPGDPTGAPTEESVAAALLELVDAAVAAGVDPEGALRRATDRRVATLRAAEPDGRGETDATPA